MFSGPSIFSVQRRGPASAATAAVVTILGRSTDGLSIVGTALVPGATLAISRNGSAIGTALVDGTGAWSLTPATPPANADIFTVATLAKTAIASYTVPGVAPSKLATLKARLQAGQRARWGMIGDSVTAGWGSNGGTGSAGATGNAKRAKSLPAELAKLFTAAGVPTRSDALWGDSVMGTAGAAPEATYNPDLAFAGGWTTSSGIGTIGGNFLYLAASGTGTITFTPEVAANQIDVYYAIASSNGGFVVSDSSGALSTTDTANATAAYGKVTVSRATSSLAPFVISRASSGVTSTTGAIFIGGLVPYDTTAPRLEIWNMGWAGSKTSDWIVATNGFNPRPALSTVVADLWSVELGANDANGGVAAATYQSNLQTILSAVTGDKLLIACHPANPTSNAYNLSAAYRQAMTDLSTAGGYLAPPDFSTSGLVVGDYFDTIHLVNSGYAKEAATLFNAVRGQLGM